MVLIQLLEGLIKLDPLNSKEIHHKLLNLLNHRHPEESKLKLSSNGLDLN